MENARALLGGGTHAMVRIVGLASAAITVPLLARYLGPAAYGRFAVALAVAFVVATVADLGLPLLASRDWPRLDAGRRNEWLQHFWSLRVWSGAFVTSIAVVAVAAVPLDAEMQTALMVALLGVPIVLLWNACGAIFLARLDPWPGVWSEAVSRLIWVGGLVVAISLEVSLVAIIGVLVLSQAASLGAMVIAAARHGLVRSPRLAVLPKTRQLARKAAPLALIPALGVVYARADTLVMASLATDAETGIYGALWRLVEVLISMAVIGAGLLLPLLSRTEDPAARRIHYVRAARLLMIVLIPAAVVVAALSGDVLRWFGGSGFFEPVAVPWGLMTPTSALVVLMAATVLMGFGVVHASVMVAADRQRALIRQSVLVVAVNLVLAFWLIGRASFVGAAWAVLLTELVSIVHSTVVVRRAIGRFRFADVLAWPLAVGGAVLVVLLAAGEVAPVLRLALGLATAAVGALMSPARADVLDVLRSRREAELVS